MSSKTRKKYSGRSLRARTRSVSCKSNKICYPSRIDALMALGCIQKKDNPLRSKIEKREYYCNYCNSWHLTSKKNVKNS